MAHSVIMQRGKCIPNTAYRITSKEPTGTFFYSDPLGGGALVAANYLLPTYYRCFMGVYCVKDVLNFIKLYMKGVRGNTEYKCVSFFFTYECVCIIVFT